LFFGKFLNIAHVGCSETRRITKSNNEILPNQPNETRKQTGKKEKGLGEGIFIRLPVRRRRTMGGSASAIPLLRGTQNREIFFSLIEKNFGGAGLKNV